MTDFKKFESLGIAYKTRASLKDKCTIHIGGEAAAAFYPESISQTAALISLLKEEKVPFTVLGKGSNILPSDEGYGGAVIFTERMNGISVGELVYAEAGVGAARLLDVLEQNGKSGAEFLAGIPCSVGGAVYMNAGAGGRYISDILESVLILKDGDFFVLKNSELKYGYKTSIFMDGKSVILGASFRLKNSTREDVKKARGQALLSRGHLPKGRSMGCVFKNPEIPAGKLIEGTGLKGMRIGGAVISEKHANFIVNDGNASAKDVKALIKLAKNAVEAQYGIRLEEEIRYL